MEFFFSDPELPGAEGLLIDEDRVLTRLVVLTYTVS
jgi:hypothetical protein